MTIGRMLDSKQLEANSGKFVVMGDTKSRKSSLKEAEDKPIMIGDHKETQRKSRHLPAMGPKSETKMVMLELDG